ncbi:DUF4199 domain-containing protein [Aquimarina sp. 2201CG14-23]|uniref:DUF4199 domain-containing protein n=1 Tax=Aquimarina mycalae TaxID=3040073 RepID=UPI00247811F2|nr:DUF4199 domain-containing protein [Aquimarina sp. 2201CG14-23]MDH7447212.1 DUF4199 domain-containing protein [Aquimarina sp. 2201CG14-23]
MGFSPKKILNYIIGIAILSGIARVALDYISRILDVSPTIYYATFFIAFILEIMIIIYAIKKYKQSKNHLTILDALKTGIIIMGIIGICYCTMAYVYDVYIDPAFQTDMTIRFTEQFSPDQLDQVKENLNNQDTSKSYIGVIMYTIWFVFLGSVISLIAGAVLKTKED